MPYSFACEPTDPSRYEPFWVLSEVPLMVGDIVYDKKGRRFFVEKRVFRPGTTIPDMIVKVDG